jgi:hypothetical protein
MKQKINMANTVIRAGIAHSFYVVSYSMPSIVKRDKIIIALQKKICGLPNYTPNVTIQLPYNLFDMEAFFLKHAYLICIGKQLRNALNDTGRIGKIYTGLTNYILAKHREALNITKITKYDFGNSPITRTLYLLKTAARIHMESELTKFPLLATPLEKNWLPAKINHLHPTHKLSSKFLYKLLLYHITDISQLILPGGTYFIIPPALLNVPTCAPYTNLLEHFFHNIPLQIIFQIMPNRDNTYNHHT